MTGNRVTIPLPVDPPYSFRWAMEYLWSSPSTVLENVDPHAGLQRMLYLDGIPVLLVLRSASEDVEHPALFVEIQSDRKISRAIRDAGLHWARNTLNLDQNPRYFLALGIQVTVHSNLIPAVFQKAVFETTREGNMNLLADNGPDERFIGGCYAYGAHTTELLLKLT